MLCRFSLNKMKRDIVFAGHFCSTLYEYGFIWNIMSYVIGALSRHTRQLYFFDVSVLWILSKSIIYQRHFMLQIYCFQLDYNSKMIRNPSFLLSASLFLRLFHIVRFSSFY